MHEFLEGCFRFLAIGGSSEDTVTPYPLVEDRVRPGLRVGMRRAPIQVADLSHPLDEVLEANLSSLPVKVPGISPALKCLQERHIPPSFP